VQLVTIDSREVAGRPGVVTETGEILDLIAAPSTLSESQWMPQSVISVLAAGEQGLQHVSELLAQAADPDNHARLAAAGALLKGGSTDLMAPVRRPGLILVTESVSADTGEPLPAASIKSPHTAIGPGQAIEVPWPENDGLQLKLQLAVVLGSPLHRASAVEAAEAIAAYTLLMDFSRPQPRGEDSASWRRYIDSKQFPGSCPMGPGLISADEFDPNQSLEIGLTVNGVAGETLNLQPTEFPAELSRLSMRYAMRPGDVIGFGGPSGLTTERALRSGDVLSADLEGRMSLDTRLNFSR